MCDWTWQSRQWTKKPPLELVGQLVHGQVLNLIGRIWQVSAIRGGCNASSGTVGHCRHHVWNVCCTQGLLRSLLPTIRNSKGGELRDPGKGGDNVHDVDGAGPGLWASRGSGPDLQNGTDNIGGRIGNLGVDAGTTTRAQNISTRPHPLTSIPGSILQEKRKYVRSNWWYKLGGYVYLCLYIDIPYTHQLIHTERRPRRYDKSILTIIL